MVWRDFVVENPKRLLVRYYFMKKLPRIHKVCRENPHDMYRSSVTFNHKYVVWQWIHVCRRSKKNEHVEILSYFLVTTCWKEIEKRLGWGQSLRLKAPKKAMAGDEIERTLMNDWHAVILSLYHRIAAISRTWNEWSSENVLRYLLLDSEWSIKSLAMTTHRQWVVSLQNPHHRDWSCIDLFTP